MHNMFVREADGSYAPASRKVILNAARAVAQVPAGVMLNAPAATRQFLTAKMRGLEHEVFAVIVLDNRHRAIEYVELFRGTVDGASVHPREVVKEVLQRNGAAVIFAHNHPSGVCEASQADELITRRLRDALALVDIRTLDHIIVGSNDCCLSFAERGLL